MRPVPVSVLLVIVTLGCSARSPLGTHRPPLAEPRPSIVAGTRDAAGELLIDALLDASDLPPELSEIRVEGVTQVPEWIPEFVGAGGILMVEKSWRNPGSNPYAVTDTRWAFVDEEGADWFLNEYSLAIFSDDGLSPIEGFSRGAYAFLSSAGYGLGQRVDVLAREGRIVIDLGFRGDFDVTSGRVVALSLLGAAIQRTNEALLAAE